MNSMSDKNALHNPFKNLERERKETKSTAQHSKPSGKMSNLQVLV